MNDDVAVEEAEARQWLWAMAEIDRLRAELGEAQAGIEARDRLGEHLETKLREAEAENERLRSTLAGEGDDLPDMEIEKESGPC